MTRGNITVSDATVAAIDGARRENETRREAADRIVLAALVDAERNIDACQAVRRQALLADMQRRLRLLADEDLAFLDELVLLLHCGIRPTDDEGKPVRSWISFGNLAQDACSNAQQRAAKIAAIEDRAE